MFMFVSTVSHPYRDELLIGLRICSCVLRLCHTQIGHDLLGGPILCSCLFLPCHIHIGMNCREV